MSAVSQKQQMLFGLVHKCQKNGICSSKKIKKLAERMKSKDVEDFARTKREDLPLKKTFKEFLQEKGIVVVEGKLQ